MKTCRVCKELKSIVEFSEKGKKSNGEIKYQSMCRECNKKYQREHYKKNKDKYKKKARDWEQRYKSEVYKFLIEYAKDGCIKCGEKHFACLQFNHIDPKTKSFSICKGITDCISIDSIKEELLKCEILCANCHAKHTAVQFGYYKFLRS